jgi:hypothetical protein
VVFSSVGGVEYVIIITVSAVGLPEAVIIVGGVTVAVVAGYLAWQAGEIVGRWITERRAQAGQQADERRIKRAAEDICGRKPTPDEEDAWHRAKRGWKGDRPLVELLHYLLDAMDCEPDPDKLAEWERQLERADDGAAGVEKGGGAGESR